MGQAGRKRGGGGLKKTRKRELSLGDLVLAKVKGFPAWPAKISRPQDWERLPDHKKYFVHFFGTSEIAFVAPVDIQPFTTEAKNKLSARCKGKTVRYFAQAVKEISEEFDALQRENSNTVIDDNRTQIVASEAHSLDPVVDEALEVNRNDEFNSKGPNRELEIKGSNNLGTRLEPCSQKQGEVEFQDVKPFLPDDVKLSPNPTNLLEDSVAVSNPSHHLLKEESSHVIKVEGRCSDNDQIELTNGHKPKLATGSKKKAESGVRRNSGSAVPREHTGEVMQRKFGSGGLMKVSSVGLSSSSLDIESERKEKKPPKERRNSGTADDGQEDAKVNFEEHKGANSRKNMKAQFVREKQRFQINEASSPAKISKSANAGDDVSTVKAQASKKTDSRSSNDLDDKRSRMDIKRLTSAGKAENRRPLRVETSNNESHHFTNEDDLPPAKRHRRASEAISNSTLISENGLGTSALLKNDAVLPNKVRSPVMLLPTKRRAVRLCDDEDDESPKTPIYGGFTSKASVNPCASDLKKKPATHAWSKVHDPLVTRNSVPVDNLLKEQVQSDRMFNKVSSPATQNGLEKKTRELLGAHASPGPLQLHSEKPFVKAKPVLVSPTRSPKSSSGSRPSAELQSKTTGNISQKKNPAGDNKSAKASDGSISFMNQSLSERSKPASYEEKGRNTSNPDLRINDSVLLVGVSNENRTSLPKRLDVGKDEKTSFRCDSKISDSVTSMKLLIAAAQARKRQAHVNNSYGIPILLSVAERSPSPTPATLAFESSNLLQVDEKGLHPNSPCSNVHHFSSSSQHENEELEERRVSSGHPGTGSSLSGGTEAAVARDAFEGMIETLSRTKESIGRATRLAIDCAKYGIASEVVELLIQKLENEPSLHRRVDLFFLVDSITQCSQRGIAGASYIPIVQAALPRLIGAAAPAGVGAQENRRQCHKVLHLWLERKILPDSVLRRYMDDIGVKNDDTSVGLSLRRPSRAERAIDDPIREMEGMVVDEYGSNATFELPGLLSARIFDEEEEEEYLDNFPTDLCKKIDDTSPSKLSPATNRDPEDHTVVSPADRRHCILEDVDGELEMEDVSGSQKDEKPSLSNDTFEPNSDGAQLESAEWLHSPEGSPPLPPGTPPLTPPLPSSPPPSSMALPPLPLLCPLPPPPVLPPPPPSTQQHLFPQPPVGPPHVLPPVVPPPPLLLSQQSFPLMSQQHMPPLPPSAVSIAREHVGYNSSRHVEYGQSDAYMNPPQASQQRQHFLPGAPPFAQKPVHPDLPTQHPPTHFPYPNSVQQHQYPPYSLQNFSDGSRRYTSNEPRRVQVNEFNADRPRGGWVQGGTSCSGLPNPHEGYFGSRLERPTASAMNFQTSGPNNLPSASQVPVHGAPMMPGRPEMSAVNWRPT